jgi:hypothetical protein
MLKIRTLLWTALLSISIGCSSTQDTSGDDTQDTTELQACDEMTRHHCMESTYCTLELSEVPNVYTCRSAEGSCEEGVSQNDLSGTQTGNLSCTEIDGCEAVFGDCYCSCRGYGQTTVEDGEEAEECNCACGGGTPPACQAIGE